MSESKVKDTGEELISEDEVQEIDEYQPDKSDKPPMSIEEAVMRRLLLALEKAVLDSRQVGDEVKSLLPAMNAVAQSIERAALSPMRMALAGCGGALLGAILMWLLCGGGL